MRIIIYAIFYLIFIDFFYINEFIYTSNNYKMNNFHE